MTTSLPTVALVYDFDGTLIPGNMQEFGLLQTLGYDNPSDFWNRCDQIAKTNDAGGIAVVMYAIQDGKLIITASFKEIKVWDVETSMQLGMDLTCFEDFNNVMFSKDGRIIIAETENDYDVAYDWLPVQELIDKAKQQVNSRQFTDAEKKKYYID